MATGSGKTVIMAGLILYLYTKGYRNFIFFVDSTSIIEKTKHNFINSSSEKYLFNSSIMINNKEVFIIGGESIYKQTMGLVDNIYVTKVIKKVSFSR